MLSLSWWLKTDTSAKKEGIRLKGNSIQCESSMDEREGIMSPLTFLLLENTFFPARTRRKDHNRPFLFFFLGLFFILAVWKGVYTKRLFLFAFSQIKRREPSAANNDPHPTAGFLKKGNNNERSSIKKFLQKGFFSKIFQKKSVCLTFGRNKKSQNFFLEEFKRKDFLVFWKSFWFSPDQIRCSYKTN